MSEKKEKEEQVAEEVKVKKIAICGCSDSKDMAPFKDASWEIWGVNNLFHHIPRYDRWFEIHNLTRNDKGEWMRRGQANFRGQDINAYVKDLAKMKCPVYMQRHWDDIPTSTVYPLSEVKKRFGSILGWYGDKDPVGLSEDQINRRLYGTNTVTYMILMAILEGAQSIGVWGVDMAVDSEYHYQRPSCEWALGIAQGMGIKVYIPAEADLLKTVHLYGFEEQLNDEWMDKLKKMGSSMGKRQNKAANELMAAKSVLDRSDGAIRTLKVWKESTEQNMPHPQMLERIAEAQQGIDVQAQEARVKHDQAYQAQQQYIGAIQAKAEITKIWGTLQ